MLLAAGTASRFGADKLLAQLAGRTLLEHSASALAAGVEQLFVVIRPDQQAMLSALADIPHIPVCCTDSHKGMGNSIAAGVRASRSASGWLVMPADLPRVAPASIAAVVAALDAGATAVRPRWGGQAGHPVGFSADCGAALAALSGEAGGRLLLAELGSEVLELALDDPGIVCDVDTPEALAALAAGGDADDSAIE
ncbi:MAG: nucleotidyltransferase family protein [Gammaproteobacteria bacterium]|nr:nucleotidyltransferase family protein [Gammaproteobacteria bacterium]